MKGLLPGWVLLQGVPLLPLLPGPLGLDWVLGPGFTLPPPVRGPVLLPLPPQQENAYASPLSLWPLCKWVAGAPSPWQRSWATSCGPGPQQELEKQITRVTHMHGPVAMHTVCGSGRVWVWACVCVHMGVASCVYCCVGENCGFVFMPVAPGSVCLCEHAAMGTGTPVCVHMVRGWLQAQAYGSHVHGAGVVWRKSWALETQVPVQVSSGPDLLCD